MPAAFPTILAVLIGLTFEVYYGESGMPLGRPWKLMVAGLLCLVPILAAEALLLAACRRFARNRPFDHRRYARILSAAPLPLYVLVLFGFDWPRVLATLSLERTFLLDHVVVLLPYLVLYVGCAVESLRMRRPLEVNGAEVRPAAFRSVRSSAVEAVRQLFLILAPMFGLLLVLDLVQDTGLRLYFQNLPLLSTLFLLGAFTVMVAAFPLVVRYSLGARPLLEGAPLRRHLERQSARLDFSCRDILMWTTRRPSYNAAIVGVTARFRYVILTADLCKQLSLDELGAVFAHEVGHAKRHHARYYLLFTLSFFAILAPLSDAVGRVVEVATDAAIDAGVAGAVIVFLPAFAGYWMFLFGFLSRRFELEADVYGAQHSRDPGLFIETLEKVARLSRIRRRARASRHFSIAGRSEFLRRVFVEGERSLLDAFRERMARVRRGITTASCAILCLAFVWLSFDSLRGVGVILLELDQRASAHRILSAYARIAGDDPVALTLLSEIELHRDKAPEAGRGRFWVRVQDRAPDLLREERRAVLDALRAGWARMMAAERSDLARILVERARRVNQSAMSDSGGPFDSELAGDLEQMDALAARVSEGDAAAVEAVLNRSPRFLRRLDMRVARRALERWVDKRKALEK